MLKFGILLLALVACAWAGPAYRKAKVYQDLVETPEKEQKVAQSPYKQPYGLPAYPYYAAPWGGYPWGGYGAWGGYPWAGYGAYTPYHYPGYAYAPAYPWAPYAAGHMVFVGKYNGSCKGAANGLYYVDDRSFAFCSNAVETIQACPGGARNPSIDDFYRGHYSKMQDFCSVNEIAHGQAKPAY